MHPQTLILDRLTQARKDASEAVRQRNPGMSAEQERTLDSRALQLPRVLDFNVSICSRAFDENFADDALQEVDKYDSKGEGAYAKGETISAMERRLQSQIKHLERKEKLKQAWSSVKTGVVQYARKIFERRDARTAS